MSYKFKLADDYCILNFSEEFFLTEIDLLESEGFKEFLNAFLLFAKENKIELYRYLEEAEDKDIVSDLTTLFKLLLIMKYPEVQKTAPGLSGYFTNLRTMLDVVEAIYLFWRRHERYAIIVNSQNNGGLEDSSFIEAQDRFQSLILNGYRLIEINLGHENNVYRQIICGVNAAISLNTIDLGLPDEYKMLKGIPTTEKVTIHPPFITYSKRNTRDGLFNEVHENPIIGKTFNKDEWYCYPIRVGHLVAFVYFHEYFMSLGSSLCNLFSMAEPNEYKDKNPDLIFVFGYDDGKRNQCFYHDEKNDIMVGYISLDDHFDYFGYMKKMILTLHNVNRINKKRLPIHGAMVNLTLDNGNQKNIIIMGDSGAGKSETIEKIKKLGKGKITKIVTVYDDMGTLYYYDNKIVSSGTEIGAFVRLDDLETGVGYKEIDRSVFLNPDKTNARIVIPIAFWRDIICRYPVDMFLYANNYEDEGDTLEFFDNTEDALKVFEAGKRMSKGTTTESGITTSFFANPFGPVQRKEQTKPLLKNYFNAMFKNNIKVGQIRTRLGVPGDEKLGPEEAAEAILKEIA